MTNKPAVKRREDYKAPDFFIHNVDLTFDIRDGETFVTSVMQVKRNGRHKRPLVLDGNDLETLTVAMNKKYMSEGAGYKVGKNTLTVPTTENQFELKTEVRIVPEKNTQLSGLYKSGDMWCTQCESEGFRNITWFVDRPDNMASYKVKVISDYASPVLLSNGNMVGKGDTADGRHYTVWDDPAPKPSYLFALVVADLDYIEDHFITMSGRNVTLRIYSDKKDTDKLEFAMTSLKNAMRWDEKKFGREYELNSFNIVAVDYFNFGAMENRSLNIFNTSCVLAHPRTQSDATFARVEGVVAHEFFHHWTGNNVTLRDWPELTLKEGLTVFRDQSFSADMGSAPIVRIGNVMELRAAQFKEDASPLAHAIRPDTYESIDNFYTPTVYRKGARVIDMFHTLLQPQGFRSAMDLYFDRYTGKAVTCDDFVQCMEDSSGYDMTQFKLWYSQAGTPTVDASWEHDPQTDKFSLTMTQKVPPTPGQDKKSPMVIPVKFGMVGSQGGDVALNAEGDTEAVLVLDQESQSFEFENIPQGSVPSILRNFSAPVILNAPYTDDQRRHLMIHDSDGFNQWEAGRQIVLKEMLAQVDRVEAGQEIIVNPVVIESLRDMINRPDMDKQLLALMLNTPGYGDMAQKRAVINPEALDKVERTFNTAIRTSLQSELLKLYQDNNTGEPYEYDRESVGRRSLKNIALYYLCADDQVNDPAMTALADAQYQTADNMTDRSAGIRALLRMNPDSPEAQSALSDFYQIFRNDSAPLDSWFAMSVAGDKDQVIEKAKAMKQHPDFRNASPNRLRALISGVTGACETYHNKDGSGYHFVADEVITQDKLNPHLAAGIVGLFADFRKLAQPWQEGMKEALLRIATQPELSSNVNDKLKKILGNDYPQRLVSVAAAPQSPTP